MAKKYSPYRGRRRGPKIFAAIVGVLVVALVVVLILAATRQIVFTPDGPRLASRVSAAPSPDAAPSPSQTAHPSTEPNFIVENTPTPTASPTPTPQPGRPDDMIAVQLDPRDEVALNGAKQLARSNCINAVMLDLSDEYGSLYWQSSTAADYGTADYGAVTEASTFDLGEIDALHEEGLYVVAQITSFRESYLWFADPAVAVHWESGTRWLDRDRRGWLDPYNATAQSYITDLVLELIDAGADEVCLRNFTFPNNGQTSVVAYDAETSGSADGSRMDTLDALYEELSNKSESAGGRIAITATAEQLNAEQSGIYQQLLASGTAAANNGFDAYALNMDEMLYNSNPNLVVVTTLTTPYTDPAAVDEIHAAIEEYTRGVVLVSSDGRYPASW